MQDLFVEIFDTTHAMGERKLALHASTPRSAHTQPTIIPAQYRNYSACQRLNILLWNYHSRLTVNYEFLGTCHVRRHYWYAQGHSFQNAIGKTLAAGTQSKKIEGRVDRKKIGPVAEKVSTFSDPQLTS